MAARNPSMAILVGIADAGPGVPPELARNIFESLLRGRAAAGAGLDLGLSLVARFARPPGG